MTRDNFILALSAYLAEAGMAEPLSTAAGFVLNHRGVECDETPQHTAHEIVYNHSMMPPFRPACERLTIFRPFYEELSLYLRTLHKAAAAVSFGLCVQAGRGIFHGSAHEVDELHLAIDGACPEMQQFLIDPIILPI
jgi:hypothetical protein